MTNINELMKTLAMYNRHADEIAGIIDGIKDEIKAYMTENNLDIVTSTEHKATYKDVTSTRIDTASLKKAYPMIADKYSRTYTSKRFTFS